MVGGTERQDSKERRGDGDPNDLLCGLKTLNAILSHVRKDMGNRSATDSAALDMAKREEQVLCVRKSVSQ